MSTDEKLDKFRHNIKNSATKLFYIADDQKSGCIDIWQCLEELNLVIQELSQHSNEIKTVMLEKQPRDAES